MLEVASIKFKSKKQLKEHVKTILAKYNANDFLLSEDKHFIECLVSLHPRATEKIGTGIKAIYVYEKCGGASRHNNFMLVRKDGTECDFSYNRCIEGRERSQRDKVSRAFRMAINDQIMRFRNENNIGGRVWNKTSMQWEPIELYHADHEYPFSMLLEDFLKLNDIEDISFVVLTTEGI